MKMLTLCLFLRIKRKLFIQIIVNDGARFFGIDPVGVERPAKPDTVNQRRDTMSDHFGLLFGKSALSSISK